MLSIELNTVGKKFNREWIFRKLSKKIVPGEKLVVLGGNGSGKSTLLQVISGFITPSEGHVEFILNNQPRLPEVIRTSVSMASPYLQLIEDFTLTELADHCRIYKPFMNGMSSKEFIEGIQLTHARNKTVKQFSSGMKQRLKLGLAILSDTPLLLLDEPLSNLDREAKLWYTSMINAYSGSRTVIVCSNTIEEEYYFCKQQLNVTDFK